MVYFCKKKFKIGLENKQTVSVVKHVKMWQFILCSVHSARSAIHISYCWKFIQVSLCEKL